MYRLAFSEDDATQTELRISKCSPLETGAFFLLRHVRTPTGGRLVASHPVFPAWNEWDVQEEHLLVPSARLISRMVSLAQSQHAGLLFLHSHPDPKHPTSFSPTDQSALQALSPFFVDVLDGPFAAAVVGPNGWVGQLWVDTDFEEIHHITSAGRGLRFLNPTPQSPLGELDSRQELALGHLHERLAACDVTIVGAGGTGSPLAETVFRMGPRSLLVVDSGHLDTASNVRRVFNARLDQVVWPFPSKANIAVQACHETGLSTPARALEADVRHASCLGDIIDTDIIMCATDSHSSRAALTAIAYAFHIPLIDAGVRVGRSPRGLEGLAAEIRVHGPGRACAWCTGTLNAKKVQEENLPPAQLAELEREGYVVGSAEIEPSVAALTVLGAGLAACALLGSLDSEAGRLPGRYVIDGLMGDARWEQTPRKLDCVCNQYVGLGPLAPLGLR